MGKYQLIDGIYELLPLAFSVQLAGQSGLPGFAGLNELINASEYGCLIDTPPGVYRYIIPVKAQR
jgi:hypothetical protein